MLPEIIADPGEQQFWRVVNSSTQTFLDLQIRYNGVAENLELISVDAVPVTGDPYVTDIQIPPAGRAEFVMTGPPEGKEPLCRLRVRYWARGQPQFRATARRYYHQRGRWPTQITRSS